MYKKSISINPLHEYIYRSTQVTDTNVKKGQIQANPYQNLVLVCSRINIRGKTQRQFLISHTHSVIGCKLLFLIHCLEEIPLKRTQRRKTGELPPIHFSHLPAETTCFVTISLSLRFLQQLHSLIPTGVLCLSRHSTVISVAVLK